MHWYILKGPQSLDMVEQSQWVVDGNLWMSVSGHHGGWAGDGEEVGWALGLKGRQNEGLQWYLRNRVQWLISSRITGRKIIGQIWCCKDRSAVCCILIKILQKSVSCVIVYLPLAELFPFSFDQGCPNLPLRILFHYIYILALNRLEKQIHTVWKCSSINSWGRLHTQEIQQLQPSCAALQMRQYVGEARQRSRRTVKCANLRIVKVKMWYSHQMASFPRHFKAVGSALCRHSADRFSFHVEATPGSATLRLSRFIRLPPHSSWIAVFICLQVLYIYCVSGRVVFCFASALCFRNKMVQFIWKSLCTSKDFSH